MESGSVAARNAGGSGSAGASGRSCRSCSSSPRVSIFASAGGSLVDLVGTNPPPADEFDIRRVEFKPGEIRVHVRNPQPDDLTIAVVDDRRRDRPLRGRRVADARPARARGRSSSRSTGSRTTRTSSA